MFKAMILKRIEKEIDKLEKLAEKVAADEYIKSQNKTVKNLSVSGVIEKDLLKDIHLCQSRIMILKGLIEC